MTHYRFGRPPWHGCDLVVVPSARIFDASDVRSSLRPSVANAIDGVTDLRAGIRSALETNRMLGRDHHFMRLVEALEGPAWALLQTRQHVLAPHCPEIAGVSLAQLRSFATTNAEMTICVLHPSEDDTNDDARLDALLSTLPANVTVWRGAGGPPTSSGTDRRTSPT